MTWLEDVPAHLSPTFTAVPRDLFVPPLVWEPQPQGGYVPVHRDTDPGRWSALVAADDSVVTQIADGQPADPTEARASSSCSQPSIVAAMLNAADLQPGHKVLEIGTGTGWNAALLSSIVGEEHVTSVELDQAVADAARKTLAAASWHPTVIVGDGTLGYPDRAPYDRVIATAAARRIPYAWVEQAQVGGLVLTPWATSWHNGTLARLVKTGPLGASGRFGGNLAFMLLRDQRTDCPECRNGQTGDYRVSSTDAPVFEIAGDFDGSFAVGLQLPGVHHLVDEDDEAVRAVRLHHPASGSWATVTLADGQVRQHGPVMLWDEATAAHAWWVEAGRPAHDEFGITVTDREQWTWLANPAHRTPLRAGPMRATTRATTP